MDINLPYGKRLLEVTLPEYFEVDIIQPRQVPPAPNPLELVKASLQDLRGDVTWDDFSHPKSVGIAINDKTRPVPHQHLLPPLLQQLKKLGIPDAAITFYVAVGTHSPMTEEEFPTILPESILENNKVLSHDSESRDMQLFLGSTKRGTPVWVNEGYFRSELKIVVGNIAPHQFMGFSGGVKSAAIGLAGLETIHHNHALMTNPHSELGRYESNPARQDVEEIGKMIGVDLALNAILTQDKKIIHVLAGDPQQVMKDGIPLVRGVCQVAVDDRYAFMIVSPGGYPKDINVYQAQKGMYHAARVMKPGGTMILVAACPEGSGSQHYEEWMVGRISYQDVLRYFAQDGFQIGPHKAYLIAKDASRMRLLLYSEINRQTARDLLFDLVDDFQETLNRVVVGLEPGERIGILPHAASTIPYLEDLQNE